MSRSEVFAKLKDIIKQAAPNQSDVIDACDESADLRTDIGLNSIGVLYIVISIEACFDISFDDVSFGDFNTVSDVVDYIVNAIEE